MGTKIQVKILKFIRRNNLTPENVLLICLSFWMTVMVTRAIIFWSIMHGMVPAIFVYGYHIHHFVTGFILLVISLLLLSKNFFSKYIPLALIGCGLGFIFDEFLFWTLGSFNYWSLINLLAVTTIGTVMIITYIHAKRDDWHIKNQLPDYLKPYPSLRAALLPVLFMVIILMAMFTYQKSAARNFRKPSIRTVDDQKQTEKNFFK